MDYKLVNLWYDSTIARDAIVEESETTMLRALTLDVEAVVSALARTDVGQYTRPMRHMLERYEITQKVFYAPPEVSHPILDQLYPGPMQVRDISQFDCPDGLKIRFVYFEDGDYEPTYVLIEVEEPGEDSRQLGYLVPCDHQREFLLAVYCNFPALAGLVTPIPRTVHALRKALQPLGMVCRAEFGEIRVTFKGLKAGRAEEVAAYATEVDDAYGTALAMFSARAQNNWVV